MPLFFFISGIFFSEKYTFKDFFVRRVHQLFFPLIGLSLLFLLLQLIVLDENTFWQTISGFYFPMALWFVGVLFVIEFCWFAVCKLTKKTVRRIFSLLVFWLVGVAVHDVWLPYSLGAVFCGIVYYGLGNIMSSELQTLRFPINKKRLVVVGSVVYFLCVWLTIIFGEPNKTFNINTICTLPFGPFAFIEAMSGICVTFAVAVWLNRHAGEWLKKIVMFYGTHSLACLPTHMFMIRVVGSFCSSLRFFLSAV